MAGARVVTVRFAEEELEEIDRFWQVRGFASRAELIRAAVREYIRRHSWRSSYPRSRRPRVVETGMIRVEAW
ncbi:MAG: hypothetical protein DRO39_01975 [Thermoprotei archaeon]|nr:MAG: hypothetical protein DRO39_01975 [Thermoprotei archaeon]